MAIILNIDTAVEAASICLAQNSKSLQFNMNSQQKDQASWMHLAIQKMIWDEGIDIRQLEAVAVTVGPGSYTGLRVGLSAAKGICFALNIPLISISTLEMMAFAVKDQALDLICPMIDARRMEVYTAVYDKNLNAVLAPCAMILDGRNFDELIQHRRILFSGNGIKKFKENFTNANATFSNNVASAADMVHLSSEKFREKRFADLAYLEPLYLKEFYSTAR